MDYVVGSVAALISGNVTPNRPKLVRRALTPTKHQPSPNVTPKSEFVEDRSIFLSPTQQKKKAIIKKSPKRIFQNPDLDVTEDCEGNSSLTSPKAEKVKKHLKDELEADIMGKKMTKSPKTTLDKTSDDVLPQKKSKNDSEIKESSPKKKKKINSQSNVENIDDNTESAYVDTPSNVKSPKKKQHNSNIVESEVTSTSVEVETSLSSTNITVDKPANQHSENNTNETKKAKKNKKKNKKIQQFVESNTVINSENTNAQTASVSEQTKNKKKKSRKKKSKQVKSTESIANDVSKPQETEKMDIEDNQEENDLESESEEVRSKNTPNPNAITEKDSDSEHDSDNEIESENEQENEKVLANDKPEESSDDEEEPVQNKSKEKEKTKEDKGPEVMTVEEVKRTLFVGNVPFSNKCKKEIKKIFSKYGQIDTIRIRTIPVKDARVTPKLAVIKNELHPERTTVNVYVKYAKEQSVAEALCENNTVLNGNHLRVSRSDSTGAEHDPRCAVFVGNLPFAIEDDVFRSKFEQCGEITSVRIIRDKKTNAGKGFGYINFASKDGVELALALSDEDLTMKNRILRVKRCTQSQGAKRGGNQGQSGGNQGQNGGKWGNRGQSGGNWGNRGQSNGNWGNRGQNAGRFGNQGQGGGKWGNQEQSGGRGGHQGQSGPVGATRRLMNKRKHQEPSSGDGPPNKRQRNVNQPAKEKKPRKEFVGMTAEKKKKHKFDKGSRKKKALSEILTKKVS